MTTISETLKQVIRSLGISDRSLGIQAGVNRQSIARFVSGETSLSLDQAERLAKFFGLELRPVESSKPRKGRG
jgi:transcriptional regulator with XRE-family HTH domain